MEHTKDATSVLKQDSHPSCSTDLIIHFEENLAKSTELVNVAHNLGLSIECEVGSIGGEEDGVVGMGECADPDECKTIADLGVDMLAAGIGNIHGKYPANWKGIKLRDSRCNPG